MCSANGTALSYERSDPNNINVSSTTATQVMIGLQQTSYTVMEDIGTILACTTVKSGSAAGRTITIDYQTVNGDVQGEYYSSKNEF